MNLDDLYSEANCRRVADWLMVQTGEDSYEFEFEGDLYEFTAHPKDEENRLDNWFRYGSESPQLIREALGREGLFVVQYNSGRDVFGNFVTGQLGLAKKGQRAALISFTWDPETDPTARHALMEALVEWLMSKPEEEK